MHALSAWSVDGHWGAQVVKFTERMGVFYCGQNNSRQWKTKVRLTCCPKMWLGEACKLYYGPHCRWAVITIVRNTELGKSLNCRVFRVRFQAQDIFAVLVSRCKKMTSHSWTYWNALTWNQVFWAFLSLLWPETGWVSGLKAINGILAATPFKMCQSQVLGFEPWI